MQLWDFRRRKTTRRFPAVILLTLLVLTVVLPAMAEESAYVQATTRLNLRSCPGTQHCSVLRTLGAETRLQVLERQGEWLRVYVLPDQEEGWVYSSYTQMAGPPQRTGPSDLSAIDLFQSLRIPFFLTGGVFLGSWLLGKRLKHEGSHERPLSVVLWSLVVGLVFILNQFGPLVAHHASSHIDLSFLSPIWEINHIAPILDYTKVIMGILLLCGALAAVAPSANGGRESFLQGFSAGFVLLPAVAVALGVAALVGWLLLLLFKVIGYVLGLIMIPFVWIFDQILLPVIRFLGRPLVWLWENYLRDFCLLIATPFVWLWNVILLPLLALLYKYFLRPALALAFGLVVATLGILPISVVGLSIIDAVRSSVRGRLDSLGLFSHGMAMGFLLFDATLLVVLDRLEILHSVPPLSLLFILSLPIFTLMRQLFGREADGETASYSFLRKLAWYSKSSKVELMSTCFIMPALLILLVLSQGADES